MLHRDNYYQMYIRSQLKPLEDSWDEHIKNDFKLDQDLSNALVIALEALNYSHTKLYSKEADELEWVKFRLASMNIELLLDSLEQESNENYIGSALYCRSFMEGVMLFSKIENDAKFADHYLELHKSFSNDIWNLTLKIFEGEITSGKNTVSRITESIRNELGDDFGKKYSYLCEYCHLNPASGIFTWREKAKYLWTSEFMTINYDIFRKFQQLLRKKYNRHGKNRALANYLIRSQKLLYEKVHEYS